MDGTGATATDTVANIPDSVAAQRVLGMAPSTDVALLALAVFCIMVALALLVSLHIFPKRNGKSGIKGRIEKGGSRNAKPRRTR